MRGWGRRLGAIAMRQTVTNKCSCFEMWKGALHFFEQLMKNLERQKMSTTQKLMNEASC
jgi:hypothetical protein